MGRKLFIIVLTIFVLMISSRVHAEDVIRNPEIVDYLEVEMIKSGAIYLSPSGPGASAKTLNAILTIPQDNGRQSVEFLGISGPGKHEFSNDEWGNRVILLKWENPEIGKNLDYEIKFRVKVNDSEVFGSREKSPVTDMIRYSPEITERAYDNVAGDQILTFFRETGWVNKWVSYVTSYTNVTKSAAWTFENREGTCDEISNLLISALKSLGYNAWYAAGYAYSDGWGPHAWVEIYYQGKVISIDPTWLESPADSTHIEFVELPDSNLTEYAEVEGRNAKIIWDKKDVQVNIVDFKTSPRFDVDVKLVPEKANSDSYALLFANATTATSDECILTKIRALSCIDREGHALLTVPERDKPLAFCGSGSVVWWMKAQEINKNLRYSCPVTVSGPIDIKMANLTIQGIREPINMNLKTKNILLQNEDFEVTSDLLSNALFSDLKFYLIFDDAVLENQTALRPNEQKSIVWNLKSPENPGVYELVLFSSNGDMVSKNITVIKTRELRVSAIQIPTKINLADQAVINITVENLAEGRTGNVKLTIGGNSYEKNITLGEKKSEAVSFIYIPESAGTKDVSITVFTKTYQDGWYGSLEVLKEKTWIDNLIEWFSGIFSFFGGLFKS
jgi:hypothetical protein